MKRIRWIGVNVALWLCLAGVVVFAQSEETWQPVAGPFGGSVAALAMSPAYSADHTVFAGLRGQGVYRTMNGGISWQASSPAGWLVVDLAISPAYATDRTVFALSGLPTAGFTLHRSTDGGASWQASVSPAKFPYLLRVSISPDFAADQTLYLMGGVASPTYVSTDGGLTFSPAGGWFETHPVSELHFSPAYTSDRTLFAVSVNDGLYKSSDGGATWALTGLSGSISAVAVSPNYAADQILLAAEYASGQVVRSTDGGATWSAPPIALSPGGQHTLRFSPTFASDHLVMAASSTDAGVYRSADGGESWTLVGAFMPAAPFLGGFVGGAVYALAIAPDTAFDAAAYAGTSSGMYLSSNRGENWYQANKGLARLTVRAIAAAPGKADLLLAGTSFFENRRFDTATPGETDGNLHLSTDGGQSWQVVSGRLEQLQGLAFSPHFGADQTAFAIAGTIGQHGFVEGGVYRSTDGGTTWQEVFGDRAFYALAVSPAFATDRTVWASAFSYAQALGLYVSTDSGQTWTALPAVIEARSLAPSPNYAVDKTIFAGTASQGLQKSSDGGLTWSQVLPQPVTALAVSPVYGASQTLYAGVQAGAGQPDRLYRSTDGGATWQVVDTGIPDTLAGEPLTLASLTFASDGSVLAGVYYGHGRGGGAVYRSVDGGLTWPSLGDGLEPDHVLALTNTPGLALSFYAGTNSGLWRLDLTQGDPAEPGHWTTNGPRGGRGQALAVSPDFQNDGLAFAGEWLTSFRSSESGLGIFKSSDEGQTWQNTLREIEAGIPYHSALHGYAFSPAFATDRTLFAGTGGGLLKSSDAGQSWEWLTGVYFGPPGSITALAVAPDYPASGHLLAGGGLGGIFVSQDSGRSWQPNYSLAAGGAIAYSPNFAADKVAFAAGGYSGLSKTNDAGATWTSVLTPVVASLAVSPAFNVDKTVLAGGEALHLSTDGGASWRSQIISPTAGTINALAISPGFSQDRGIFAGANNGLYWSADGGASWQAVNDYAGVRIIALAISPGWPVHPVLLVGTARGVYRMILSGPPGGTLPGRLRLPTQGLATLSTEALALAADESLLLAGASNHGLYGSPDGGSTWQPLGLQEGNGYYGLSDMAISPAYPADQTLFAAWGSGVSIGGNIYRTRDGGENWQNIFSAGYIGGLAISPQYAADHTLYATADNGRVLRSTNGGDSWAELGSWPGGLRPPVLAIAVPPTYPGDRTVFVGSAQGFWRLPAGGTTWQAASSGLDSSRYVQSMAVSPTYATDQTLLATASWAEQGGAVQRFGVYRSTDGGVNWTLVNSGLPETSLHTVAYSPHYATDRTVYLSAGQGQLFRSTDGSLSWVLAHRVPGQPDVFELVVDHQGQVNLASKTGVWRYSSPVQDMLLDGGFEATRVWDLPQTPRPASLSSQVVFAGWRSVQIGLTQGSNIRTYASARQIVSIPPDVTTATLNFSLYLASGETTSARQEQFSDRDLALEALTSAQAATGDAQYVLILQPDSGVILQTLFWTLSNAQSWQTHQVDLTPYAGQRIRLHFGVYNDGSAGQTAMVVDHVSLLIDRSNQAPLNFRLYLPLIVK